MDSDNQQSTPLADRAKEPSSWLGAAVVLGGFIGQATGKPTLGDPLFWQALINVAAGIGLIITPQKRKSP